MTNIKPFICWQGGKKNCINLLLERVPKTYNNYYECFLGSGRLYFALNHPNKAYLSDLDKNLINAFLCIQNNSEEFIKFNQEFISSGILPLSKENFKKLHWELNNVENNDLVKKSHTFLLLLKYAFGMVRYNKSQLNLSQKGFDLRKINNETIKKCAEHLKNATISCKSYSTIKPNKDDFVYLDPPYLKSPGKKMKIIYLETYFGLDENEKLFEFFKKLDNLGCKLMMSQGESQFIKDLYKDYLVEEITVKRQYLKNSPSREVKEYIIRNYE